MISPKYITFLKYSIILSFILVSCNKQYISYEQLSGIYVNRDKDHPDYNMLILRADSTYTLTQSPLCGDNWLHYDGSWKISRNTLFLYKGVDFTNDLHVEETVDYNSDSLTIEIDKSLYDCFPNLKIWIEDIPTDLHLENGKITICKTNYWEEPDETENKYEYAFFNLALRQGNYHARIAYIFKNRYVKISLNDDVLENNTQHILMKYSVKDNYIKTRFKTYNKPHSLKKITEYEYYYQHTGFRPVPNPTQCNE